MVCPIYSLKKIKEEILYLGKYLKNDIITIQISKREVVKDGRVVSV